MLLLNAYFVNPWKKSQYRAIGHSIGLTHKTMQLVALYYYDSLVTVVINGGNMNIYIPVELLLPTMQDLTYRTLHTEHSKTMHFGESYTFSCISYSITLTFVLHLCIYFAVLLI